jgi:hypothetical protein
MAFVGISIRPQLLASPRLELGRGFVPGFLRDGAFAGKSGKAAEHPGTTGSKHPARQRELANCISTFQRSSSSGLAAALAGKPSLPHLRRRCARRRKAGLVSNLLTAAHRRGRQKSVQKYFEISGFSVGRVAQRDTGGAARFWSVIAAYDLLYVKNWIVNDAAVVANRRLSRDLPGRA